MLELENQVYLPYEDIPKEIWEEVFLQKYPQNWLHRMEIFKYSLDYKNYLENKLSNINLTKLLKI